MASDSGIGTMVLRNWDHGHRCLNLTTRALISNLGSKSMRLGGEKNAKEGEQRKD